MRTGFSGQSHSADGEGPPAGLPRVRWLPASITMRLSLTFIGLIAFACIFGPFLLPHSYDRVYRDYVLVPPSQTSHPSETEIDAAIDAIAARLHVAITDRHRKDTLLSIMLVSEKPVDPRALRGFERSDIFGPARLVSRAEDGRRLILELPLQQQTFLFGTDANGRDLLARILIAGRISLAAGLLASLVALVIGTAWGTIAGYFGGKLDMLMMRIVEIIYALPFIFLVILLVVVFGRHFVLIFVAIGAVEWLDMARIVRGQTLSLKRRDYVLAAEALGARAPAILWRHIIPNALGPIAAYLTLLVPRIILLESFVSFLGLGVQEPLTSWGLLIADGARNIQSSLHLLVFPALFLAGTLAALNRLGESWRDALGLRDA